MAPDVVAQVRTETMFASREAAFNIQEIQARSLTVTGARGVLTVIAQLPVELASGTALDSVQIQRKRTSY